MVSILLFSSPQHHFQNSKGRSDRDYTNISLRIRSRHHDLGDATANIRRIWERIGVGIRKNG